MMVVAGYQGDASPSAGQDRRISSSSRRNVRFPIAPAMCAQVLLIVTTARQAAICAANPSRSRSGSIVPS
jgi:hypothetical protein